MKKTYQMPEMQVLLHSEEDVVRTSMGEWDDAEGEYVAPDNF